MKWSLNLGKLFGIRIWMHWSFLLLLLYVVYVEIEKGSSTSTILLTLVFVLSVFLCVVLHEIGHSLAARKFNIQTQKITLLPIGGVANLERMPEEPRHELWIAVAGPLVNVVIAMLIFLLSLLYPVIPDVEFTGSISANNFLYSLMVLNIVLVLFNAIPAFPMDGGRILRALIAIRFGRARATQIASVLGQIIALGFVVLGFLYNPFLIFIGLFVFFGAYAENMMVQQVESMRGYFVKDAMMTKLVILSPDDSVKYAIEKLIEGQEEHFVVMQDEEVLGVVSKDKLLAAVKDSGLQAAVGELLQPLAHKIGPDEKLKHVYNLLMKTKSRFIPVIENGKLVGGIDMNNINEFLHLRSSLN